jgi:hypothetical protein
VKIRISIILFLLALIIGCGVYDTMVNISRLKFKLESVNDFKVAGIGINKKSKLEDFNTMDVLKLTQRLANNELPVSFRLNVEAKNPNSEGGMLSDPSIKIKSFPWTLYIEDKETINGNIDSPLVVPGKGESRIIGLNVEFNFLKFIRDKNLEKVANIILNIGGAKGSPSSLKLIAEPVLDTPAGEMKYPEPLTIISKEFR